MLKTRLLQGMDHNARRGSNIHRRAFIIRAAIISNIPNVPNISNPLIKQIKIILSTKQNINWKIIDSYAWYFIAGDIRWNVIGIWSSSAAESEEPKYSGKPKGHFIRSFSNCQLVKQWINCLTEHNSYSSTTSTRHSISSNNPQPTTRFCLQGST